MRRASRKAVSWIALIVVLIAVAAAAAATTMRAHQMRDALMRADPETILDKPDLANAALSAGRNGFAVHCASCHGAGGGNPANGVPDLTDADFLYGTGQVSEIEQIILHGIRSGDPRGWNLASMPVYARAKPYAAEPIPPLTPGGIRDVTQFLMRKHGRETDAVAADRGAKLYGGSGGCWDCHGPDGGGDEAIGAPNLLDDIWLYGDGSPASIERTIANGRAGFSPAFVRTLKPAEVRAVAVYVASLFRHRVKASAR